MSSFDLIKREGTLQHKPEGRQAYDLAHGPRTLQAGQHTTTAQDSCVHSLIHLLPLAARKRTCAVPETYDLVC